MKSRFKKVTLGEIASISSGGTPSRSVPEYWNGNIPWVKTTQIQNRIITEKDVDEWISEKGLKNSSAKIVPIGTILMAMIGQGKTRGQVGYLTFASCTNQNAAAIICKEICHSQFLYQLLLFNYKNIRSLSNNSGQGNLNIKIIENISIPLPPLSEQRAIADILSTWDTAIETTEKLIAAKEERFRWLLDELITKPSRSGAWEEVAIRELLRESRVNDTLNFVEKRISVRLHLKGVEARDVRGTESEGATNYFIRSKGQFIYGKQNIFRGALGIIPEELDGYSSTQDLPAFDFIGQVDPEWFLCFFSRQSFYEGLEKLSTGSGAKRLHPEELFSIRIPVPPLKKQHEIRNLLNQANREVRILQDINNYYKQQKRGLMQKLLTGEWRVKGV